MASPSSGEPPSGLLLIDKPAGISSHSVVARVRRLLPRGAKVGHAGTLDPFATGLMLVLIGRGTRIAQFLSQLDKRYLTEAQLGALSSTGDPEGEITHTGRIPSSPLTLPTGELRQRPPAYSAIKVDGERAYRRARRGEAVEVPERTVQVHAFTELARDGDRVTLEIHCGSGTYVRTLVQDLGDGYCLTLRRTAVGPWQIGQATPLDALTSVQDVTGPMLGLADALAFLPRVELAPQLAADVHHGRRPACERFPAVLPVGRPLLLVDPAGPVAVGQSDGTRVSTVVGFRA